PAQHLAATVVDADRGAARVVLADRGRGLQVERAGPEPVLRAGQRTDRADLDRVAREVAGERLLLVDADLLERTSLEQLDERVAGDLLREPGAPGAEHASLAVQQDLAGDRDRLLIRALLLGVPGLGPAVAH